MMYLSLVSCRFCCFLFLSEMRVVVFVIFLFFLLLLLVFFSLYAFAFFVCLLQCLTIVIFVRCSFIDTSCSPIGYELLTIEHMLLTCSDFTEIRKIPFTALSLRALFQGISPEKLLTF